MNEKLEFFIMIRDYDEVTVPIEATTEEEAIKEVKDTARTHPESQVFLAFFRPSDGMTAYINQYEGAALTGRPWK